jgi:signal-transduction protein with cAMP-binding, CBS, and nucleotidyltransferase domain
MKTAEEMIKEQNHDVIHVSPETTIKEALAVMNDKKIGAILIKGQEDIEGIWTERDLMRNVLQPGFNPDTAKIGEHMTKNLHYAEHSETTIQLQDKFLGLRIRHLLIRNNGKFIGMVSSGDVTRHSLNEKTEELKSLNKIINWEYYENWHWKK